MRMQDLPKKLQIPGMKIVEKDTKIKKKLSNAECELISTVFDNLFEDKKTQK